MSDLRALSQYIPYSSHITPEIIKLNGGSYMMNFRLKGVNYVGQAQEIIDNRVIQINNFINKLRAPYRYNLYLQTHCVRSAGQAHLPSHFKDKFAFDFNQAYEQKVIYEQQIISTDYYISLIYRPYLRIKGFSAFKTTKKEIAAFAKQAEEILGRLKETILSEFKEYNIEILRCYEENGVEFSEQLRFLNYLCNLNHEKVPLQRAQISEYLPTATISIGNSEFLQIDNKGERRYAVILTFAEYPFETRSGMLQKFMEMPWQMTITQSFVPIDKTEAKGWLSREFNRLQSTDSSSYQDLEDIAAANEAVSADRFVLGDFYWSVMLIDDDIVRLKRKIAEADAILSNAGFRASVNKIAKLNSYFAQLPGNIALEPRKAKLSSANTAQLMPFLKQNHGKQFGNPWGQALAMLRTINDEVYYFNFHAPEEGEDSTGKDIAGNTFISGVTGTGKTVLVSFLLAQSQRYKNPPRIVMFDKDLGSSVFIHAMGGKYSQVKIGEPTGWNPFHLPDTPTNRAFLAQLIKAILAADKQPISARESSEIEEAIVQTLRSDKAIADIEAFSNFLPDGDNSIRQRLKPWTTGQYSWVFNNPEDHFATDAHILGIDYTQFLDIDAIRTPILMYLFHRIQEMLDGTPLIISLDEAWKPLKDPMFQAYLDDKQRTIRKERGLLVFASQSPTDAYEGLSDSFLEQIVTHIFLPNPRAKYEVYVNRLGLEEEEYELVKNLNKHSREFLVRHQGSTAHCKLSLKGIKEVDVMSGSASKSAIADALMKTHGDNWLEAYYQAMIDKKDQILQSN